MIGLKTERPSLCNLGLFRGGPFLNGQVMYGQNLGKGFGRKNGLDLGSEFFGVNRFSYIQINVFRIPDTIQKKA